MKIPALWITLCFTAGAALQPLLSRHFSSFAYPYPPPLFFSLPLPLLPTLLLASSFLLLFALLSLRLLPSSAPSSAPSFALSLLLFLALGLSSAQLSLASIPPDDASLLPSSSPLFSAPLRWRGTLLDSPSLLPFGARLDLSLSSVSLHDTPLPIHGGLRVTYFYNPRSPETLPPLHPGDSLELLLRARPPRNFMDDGAFDLRASLARQGVNLTGTLRTVGLLQKIGPATGDTNLQSRAPRTPTRYRLARLRDTLLARIDSLFQNSPDERSILRAMLLGDRNFIDSATSLDFQKIGAFHVLVVAGLHVGAICLFLVWLTRKVRIPLPIAVLCAIAGLLAYVAIVQDRPPVLRATLTAIIYLAARPFFRRTDLVNTVSLAALLILIFRPFEWSDPSFQLSFLAAGSIAALGLPLIGRAITPRRTALKHLGDVTRDLSYRPLISEMRIDLRAMGRWIARKLPKGFASRSISTVTGSSKVVLWFTELLAISLVLQMAMAGLIVGQFHRVSLAGLVSNIPAVVLTGLIVPVGFLTLTISFLWVKLGGLLAATLGLLVRLLMFCVHLFARIPLVSYRIPGAPAWLLAISFALLCVLAALGRAALARQNNPQRFRHRKPDVAFNSRRPIKRASTKHNATWRRIELCAVALFVVVVALITIHPFRPRLQKNKLEVTVLDVSQGDSIFVAFPNGTTMLIDGGGEPGSEYVNGQISGMNIGEEVVAPYLWSRGIKRLDVVVLTHAHHDHLDGLHAILDDFQVKELWVGSDVKSHEYKDLIAQAERRGVRVIHRRETDSYQLEPVHGDILWPSGDRTVNQASNDDSVVMRLTDRQMNFMLPGDAEEKVEKELVESGRALHSEFLKVPHHGSKTSSSEGFLKAVSPQVAVISVGQNNPFGHPARAVLDRYRDHGIRLLRTDQDGSVTAITDGKQLQVSTYRETHPAENEVTTAPK